MAQILVRNIEQDVKTRLQRRAQRHGRSMEEEVREILRNAVHEPEEPAVGLGTQIASLFAGRGFKFEAKEWRGYRVRPNTFDASEE